MAEQEKLSTSALAKRLELPGNAVFSALLEQGWIKKLEDGWGLTAKGEFEGGEYKHSKRYGRYIIWPETLLQHQLFRQLEETTLLGAEAIGRPFGLTSNEVNRAIAELGWQRRNLQGWLATGQGRALGATAMENKKTGMRYLLWPANISDQAALKSLLTTCAAVNRAVAEPEVGDDLFSQSELHCVDGHRHDNAGTLRICHWLYLAGVAHATARQLPGREDLRADFYLPGNQVYIEYWPAGEGSANLAARMERAAFYREKKLNYVELHSEDLSQLDEFLPRQLDKFSVRYL